MLLLVVKCKLLTKISFLQPAQDEKTSYFFVAMTKVLMIQILLQRISVQKKALFPILVRRTVTVTIRLYTDLIMPETGGDFSTGVVCDLFTLLVASSLAITSFRDNTG